MYSDPQHARLHLMQQPRVSFGAERMHRSRKRSNQLKTSHTYRRGPETRTCRRAAALAAGTQQQRSFSLPSFKGSFTFRPVNLQAHLLTRECPQLTAPLSLNARDTASPRSAPSVCTWWRTERERGWETNSPPRGERERERWYASETNIT